MKGEERKAKERPISFVLCSSQLMTRASLLNKTRCSLMSGLDCHRVTATNSFSSNVQLLMMVHNKSCLLLIDDNINDDDDDGDDDDVSFSSTIILI